MQVTTPQFDARASSNMRHVTGKVFMSFNKTFNDATDFFTLDVSSLDGGDILQGEGDTIQEWDKYEYTDYSNRLISLEWSRQEDPVSSVTLATADIELDNHDDFFTPGGGSAIDDFVLPNRPVRLYCGFGGEDLPVFVGLTEAMPEIDKKEKVARFHCVDFMQSLFNRPLAATPLYLDFRTDEILSDLLVNVGLLPSQFVLDMGINTIPYAFFKTRMKLGEAVDQLMVPEQGRLFMDENGIIRFKNRSNYPTAIAMSFDGSNVLDSETIKFDEIINVVETRSNVLGPQEFQKLYELPESKLVRAGESIELWAEFQDPVTECVPPVYVDSAVESYFATSTNAEGTGTDVLTISLTDSALYSTSFKMTFTNSGPSDAYVTNILLYGTPIKDITSIYVREQDDDSVEKYDEHVKEIENEFIQTQENAISKAVVLLEDYKDYNKAQSLTIKGNPALQLSDLISVNLDSPAEYLVTKINGRLMDYSFKQDLEVKQFTRRVYFTLDVSSLDSGDELGI